jgi:hypothetical protein
MPLPDWRPMPTTDGLSLKDAAIVRSRHRNLMSLRWRSRELRAEDRAQGRLPANWHDWMMCPADDGYGSRGCTCDQALNQHPREVRKRVHAERAQVSLLQRSQPRQRATTRRPRSGRRECVFTVWLPVIDSGGERRMVTSHGTFEVDRQLAAEVLRAATAAGDPEAQGRRSSRPGIPRRQLARTGSLLRQSSWAAAGRHHLSRLRASGGPGAGMGTHPPDEPV